jgi:hypothetical protein
MRQVDRNGRLSNTTFIVDDRDNHAGRMPSYEVSTLADTCRLEADPQ